MNKNKQALYIIVVGIAIVAGMAIGHLFSFNDAKKINYSLSKKDKLDNLFRYLREEYVDTISTDSIVDKVIKDVLKNLDPHSSYIPKQDVEKAEEELDGEFTGIGVLFQNFRDTFTIIRPLENSPAQKAGLKAMDRILKVNDDTIFGKHLIISNITSKIKGKVGSKLKLTIYRKTNDSIFEVELTREKLPITSVPAHFMINDSIGLIKIETFSADTYDEFDSALKDLKQKGLKQLILDLRDNTGGLVKQADLIADEFLKNGKLIFFTKDKKGKIVKAVATSRGRFEEGQVYVLINERTASASEIVSGALQDNDRASIVGRRSFGKGLVQREMQLGDGSIVRLTTARYYTPTGRSIQKPYQKGHIKEYEQQYENRMYNGELYNKDSIPINDSLKFTTPGGRTVYGGGGITPDIFVPIQTGRYAEMMYMGRYISDFITEYIDKNIKKLDTIPENNFVADDKIGDELYKAFAKKHATRKKHVHSARVKKKKLFFKRLLKAYLARDLYGNNTFYKILFEDDPMVKKIIDTMLEENKVEQQTYDQS